MPKVLRVLVFLVVPLTSISLCDRILPFHSLAFFFLTPLSYSTFLIVSATGTDTLAPCSDPLDTVPQDHLIPTYWDFTRLSVTVSVVLSVVFRCCMFLKRAAMFNIMKHDVPPPLPTIESSDEFQRTLSRIGLYYTQHTCSSPKPYLPECMQGERIAETSKSLFLRTDFISQCTPKMGGKRSIIFAIFFHHRSPMLLQTVAFQSFD